MINTGLAPLPRNGFRHIPRTQAHFTYPSRTDFQIIRESPPCSFTEGSYQVLLQKEQAEIRNVQIMSDTWDPGPPQFAASRKSIIAAWAKPLSLAPLISLPAARFHLMRSSYPGGLKVEEISKLRILTKLHMTMNLEKRTVFAPGHPLSTRLYSISSNSHIALA